MTKLALHGLTKRFGDFVAVDSIDLELAAGEFVSLLGPSGCGKTTTLRMIAGFVDPTAGSISVDGETLSSTSGSVPPERRRMSMIFQSYAVWPNMTVEQNVAFGLELRKLPRGEVRRRVRQVLEVVQMGPLAARYPAELSGGQQQRVALARAIVIEPEVLLLDEPLSNLDANLREEMRFEIRRLHDEFRITTVYVTHDQTEAMVTSDRIAVMNQGRIEQIDKPHTLYNKPKTPFVATFIGRTNLIGGVCKGEQIVFDAFMIPRRLLDVGAHSTGKLTFSIRPHSMRLMRDRPAPLLGVPPVEVSILERACLGEVWDYIVRPRESGLKLKVSAPPLNEFATGESAWLAFDVRQIALV